MPPLDEIGKAIGLLLGGGLVGLIPHLMYLRRQSSKDAAARAADGASESKSFATRDYFDNVLADRKELLTDRDSWKKTANEAWGLLRLAESQIARLTTLQELHERQLIDRDKQIDKLWRLVIRFAPDSMKAVLQVEFAQTAPGSLDSVPSLSGKKGT